MANIREGNSSQLTFAIKDGAGAAIPKASLTALTLLLYDVDTLGVINSRNYTSVLDANGGVVASDGTGTVTFGPADNPVVKKSRVLGEVETHAAVLKFTTAGGAAGSSELRFPVERVP